MSNVLYTSDSHFGHANIIRFTHRPFNGTVEMDRVMVAGLRAAEATGARIYHAGDVGFLGMLYEKIGGSIFTNPERHTLVGGNHDKLRRPDLLVTAQRSFGSIVGNEKTWRENNLVITDTLGDRIVRVMVTHDPVVKLPDFIDYNVYGHYHNNLDHSMPWHIENLGREWVEQMATSPRHLNACVELTNFIPAPLEALIAYNDTFKAGLREKLKAA